MFYWKFVGNGHVDSLIFSNNGLFAENFSTFLSINLKFIA